MTMTMTMNDNNNEKHFLTKIICNVINVQSVNKSMPDKKT